MQGKESTGANSIDIFDEGFPDKPGKYMIIVGGDFAADSLRQDICIYTKNGGKTWNKPKIPLMVTAVLLNISIKKTLLPAASTA